MRRSVVVAALGTAQTLAWGSSYYLPAILADPIAQALGLSRTTVFGLFSGALLLSAVLGPSVGRAIDNRGGRGVLALSNLVLAAGLVLLGVAQGLFILAVAWAVLGVGMAMGLYDPAFATLTGLYGRAARGPITGITLIAGFASTVGIGSDFDGAPTMPEGLEDVSRYPALFEELASRGYASEDLQKIAGRNVLRVMREAERTGAHLRAGRSPSTATIGELDTP